MRSRFIAVLWVLTAIFCMVLVTDVVPWLRGVEPWLPGDLSWEWLYAAPRWGWLIASIVGMVIYVVGVAHILEHYDDSDSRYPVRLILWSFVGTALITLLVMGIEATPLFALFSRSASLVTGGYQYSSIMMPQLKFTLQHWPQFVEAYKERYWINSVTTSPPGWDAVFYASTQAFAAVPPAADTFGSILRPLQCQDLYIMSWSNAQLASAWPEMGMPLWASLAVAPVYNVGLLAFDRKRARYAVALWPLVPGLILFSPRFNVFYPLVGAVMLSLTWRGLVRRRWLPIALAGFAVGVSTFLNLAVVPLALLSGATIVGWGLLERGRWGEVLRYLIAFGVAAIAFWLAYWVLSGLSIIDILNTIFGYHFVVTNRPYWPWIIQHPIDMFLFVGLPMSAVIIWRMWLLVKQRKLLTRADVFVGAALITLLATDLSGINKGETGRLWLIFAPAWLLLCADMLLRLDRRSRLAFLAMQTLVLLSMGAVLRVHFTGFSVPVTPETASVAAQTPADATAQQGKDLSSTIGLASSGPQFPVNAQLVRGNDKLTFVGLDVARTPNTVNLRLHWRADSPISGPYFLSIVPVPPDKSVRQGITWVPNGWEKPYPPSCWLPGQEFVDNVIIPLGDKPQPGNWLFSLAISDYYTHDMMKIAGQDTSQIGIGPVNVPAQ